MNTSAKPVYRRILVKLSGEALGGQAGSGICPEAVQNMARQIGSKSVEPCTPEVANRHSGYLVGGTSPFGLRKAMPIYVEETILSLPKILINGGSRGYLVGIDPTVCTAVLGAVPVRCALEI